MENGLLKDWRLKQKEDCLQQWKLLGNGDTEDLRDLQLNKPTENGQSILKSGQKKWTSLQNTGAEQNDQEYHL